MLFIPLDLVGAHSSTKSLISNENRLIENLVLREDYFFSVERTRAALLWEAKRAVEIIESRLNRDTALSEKPCKEKRQSDFTEEINVFIL
jgi:hypothetical protein